MNSIVDEVIQELLKRLGIKTALIIGEKRCGIEKSFLTVSDSDNFDVVIIRNLSNKMLADLALGVVCTDEEKSVYKAFCEKKNVYVIKDGIEYINGQALNVLSELYYQYLKKIEQCGAIILGRVISEKIIDKFYNDGINEIYITSKDIITPLAYDFIRKHNITIDRG